ncbi:hypothetical protein KZY98_10320 [Croceibacter atlanticus]|jgi:hypothetical protein|nr:hypothetical protein [Croceibacter atlanticus]|tara:strand:+ start:5431 stop:5586 length:156 start_codon:yes stop_codon:yes gene_type:complete
MNIMIGHKADENCINSITRIVKFEYPRFNIFKAIPSISIDKSSYKALLFGK